MVTDSASALAFAGGASILRGHHLQGPPRDPNAGVGTNQTVHRHLPYLRQSSDATFRLSSILGFLAGDAKPRSSRVRIDCAPPTPGPPSCKTYPRIFPRDLSRSYAWYTRVTQLNILVNYLNGMKSWEATFYAVRGQRSKQEAGAIRSRMRVPEPTPLSLAPWCAGCGCSVA